MRGLLAEGDEVPERIGVLKRILRTVNFQSISCAHRNAVATSGH